MVGVEGQDLLPLVEGVLQLAHVVEGAALDHQAVELHGRRSRFRGRGLGEGRDEGRERRGRRRR